MIFPTWGELISGFCTQRDSVHYEDFAARRYNYAPSLDEDVCRLIFLKDVAADHQNKTLRRKGRFLWCKNLSYEGINAEGYREISFSVDTGRKRFRVSELNMLCLPSTLCVPNNRYFRSKSGLMHPFSSVFAYNKTLKIMSYSAGTDRESFAKKVTEDAPYKPGTLVIPRQGYFHPEIDPNNFSVKIDEAAEHPCGIILGPSLRMKNAYMGKEFYRVRFGDTTYEKVHPVQMEIVNEI